MSRESAKANLDRQPSDPTEGYITPDRHKQVIDTVYDDLNEQTSLTVAQYGAVGDGLTDDTASIQAAITAAGEGSVVSFPAGTNLVSATLFPLAGQTWRGVHNPKYVKEDDPNSTCVLKAHSTFTGRAMVERQAGASGVRLESLCFWGQGDTTGGLHGVHLGDMTAERAWLIDNCTIHGFAGHGVTGRLHVFDMRDTHVARCGWGIRQLADHAMTDVRVTNCQFYYNLDGGIGLEGTRRNGAVEFTGCRVERSGNTPGVPATPRNANAPGIKITNAQNMVLSQVSTDANTGVGLEIDAPRTGGQFVYAVSIIGCNFIRDGGGDQGSPQIPGLKLKGCDHVMVVGTHVTWGQSDDAGGGVTTPYYSIWLEDTQFVKITDSWYTAPVEANSINTVGTNWRTQIESPHLNLSAVAASTDTARQSSPPQIGNWYYSTTTDRPLFWDGTEYRDAIGKPEVGSDNLVDLRGTALQDKAINYFSDGVLKWATAVNPDGSGGLWALRLHDPVTGAYDYDFIRATNDDTIRFPNTQVQAQKQGTAFQVRSFDNSPTGSFINVGTADGTPVFEVLWNGVLRSNWGSPDFAKTQVGSLQVVRDGAGAGNTMIAAYTSTADAGTNTSVFNVEGNGRIQSTYDVQPADFDSVMTNKGYVDAIKTELKALVALSTDFADFKTRVAAW